MRFFTVNFIEKVAIFTSTSLSLVILGGKNDPPKGGGGNYDTVSLCLTRIE